jgi:hypothetical protein
MAHEHANAMMEYAKDAAETDKPWERWETRPKGTEYWYQPGTHPCWFENYEYRRKPNQAQIDYNAFKEWYSTHKHDIQGINETLLFLYHADAWFAALEWERSRNEG